jgi:hypothetical protein
VFLVIASEQPDISVAPFLYTWRCLQHEEGHTRANIQAAGSTAEVEALYGFVMYFTLQKRDAGVGVGGISQTRHRLQTFDTDEFLSEVGSFTGASQLINRGLNHFSALLTP